MNTLCSSILLTQLLLHLLPVCDGSTQTLIGQTGGSVTLPCLYDVKANGLTTICWGRDVVPTSKCSNTIVSTDGEQVTIKESRRYRLQSGLKKGNVSLTIVNLTEEDSGIYGCRVEIPGMFNDKKLNFDLTVVKDQGKTQIKTNYQLPITTTKSRAASFTEPSPLNVTQAREVQPSCSNQTHFQSQEEDHRPRLPAAILLPLLLLLLLAAILLFMMWLKIQKGLLAPKEPSSSASSIFYVNSVSTLQKAGRETAVENLYQFDAAEAHP